MARCLMRGVVRVIAVALAATSCGRAPDLAKGGPLMQRLAAQVIDRPFAARLSIPVTYRDCHASAAGDDTWDTTSPAAEPLRCGDETSGISGDIAALAVDAARQVSSTGDVDALHTAALLDLIWAGVDSKSVDKAITLLEAARRHGPEDASVLVDLSAAYLQRGARTTDARDYAFALEYATRALVHDSLDVSAACNRALALRGLQLQAAFVTAVHRAPLARGGSVSRDDPWKAEMWLLASADSAVVFHVPWAGIDGIPDAAVATAVRTDPAAVRSATWATVLARWGEAVLQQDSIGAARALARAAAVATALRQARGDTALAIALRDIAATSEPRRPRLAAAHGAFGRAREAYEHEDFPRCLSSLDTSLASAAPRTALHDIATLWRALCVAQSGPPAPTVQTFARLIAVGDSSGSTALAARARSALASAYMRLGRAAEAVPLLREAERLFARIGERTNVGLAESLEAVAQRTLGDRTRTYEAVRRAAQSLRTQRQSVRLHNAYYLLAELMVQDSIPLAALEAQREGLQVARNSRDPLNIAEAQVAMGRILRALRDSAGTAAAFDSARATLHRAPASIGRSWVESDLRLGEGEGIAQHPTPERLARLDSAITFYRSINLPLKFLPALELRARYWMRSGRRAEAREDLDALLATVMREVRAAQDAEQRTLLLALARSATENLMRLELATGHPAQALAELERGRDALRNDPDTTDSGGSGRRAGVILDLAMVEDTLFQWIVTPDSTVVRRSPVPAASLHESLRRVRSMLELGVDARTVQRELESLYSIVIAPVESLMPDSGQTVTIVADGELADAPVAAFRDPRGQRFFIERWGVHFAATLRDARSPLPGPGAAAPTALLIADPAFDRSRYPRLPRLTEARAEIRDLAAFYPGARLLEDAAATLAAVRQATAAAAVVHFAGHATFDASAPQESELVLSGDVRASATALEALDLHRTALVVLAACETARTGDGRAGGLLGLTGALRRAGARSVVGGLWRTPDRMARRFFTAFHASYVRSRDPAQALRAAQLVALRSPDREMHVPLSWAGFRVTGLH